MRFSASNIKLQEFTNSLRGYDKEEVRVFLEKIAEDFERLEIREEELLQTINKLNSLLEESKLVEKRMQDALLTMQESAKNTEGEVNNQVSLKLKDAEIKAMQIIFKADEEAEQIRKSVLELKEAKNLFLARLKAVVETQDDILEEFTEDSIKLDLKNESRMKKNNNSEMDIDDILEKLI